MDKSSVTLAMFATAWFERISFRSIWALLRDSHHVTRTSGTKEGTVPLQIKLPNKLRIASFVFCIIYLMLFPTILSAMSGCQAELTSYTKIPPLDSGIVVNSSEIIVPSRVIVDGHRIGLNDDFPIMNLNADDQDTAMHCKSVISQLNAFIS